ncbi:MAG: cytochrome c-type biogenesis protein CcmH [ANME-2 cluster archaeon]|nr:cytochrome c-type biogenesis protein CcmH [ANME-2 cluster archaeon]
MKYKFGLRQSLGIRLRMVLLMLILLPSIMPVHGEPVHEEDITEILRCQCGCTMIVKDCSCEEAVNIRQVVRDQIVAGKSDKQIFSYLEKTYGEGIFAVPPKKGFDLSLWVLPGIGVAIGGVVLYRVKHNSSGDGDVFDDEYRQFLKEQGTAGVITDTGMSYEQMLDLEYRKNMGLKNDEDGDSSE